MSENENEKPIYQTPTVVPLGGMDVSGKPSGDDCENGSAATKDCSVGPSALSLCNTGVQANACENGTDAGIPTPW